MSKLKKCPFCPCGGEPDHQAWASAENSGPGCNKCGATAETVEVWNKRPAEESLCEAMKELLEMVGEPPEKNCSCHIAPPCTDCVEWSGLREAIAGAREAMRKCGGE